MSFCGEANTVAAFAEVMLMGIDEAEFVSVLFDAVIVGGAGAFASETMDRVTFLDPFENLFAVKTADLIAGVRIFHILDEADFDPAFPGIFEQIEDFVVVDPLERHHVDFDTEAHFLCTLDALEDFTQNVFLCDAGSDGRFERIERDIETLEARFSQFLSCFRKKIAVCRQRQIDVGLVIVDHRHKSIQILSQKRLPPGDTDLLNPFIDSEPDKFEEILETEKILLRNPAEGLFRHTVLATEIATLGHRHSKVVDSTAMSIDQHTTLFILKKLLRGEE